MGSLSKRKHNGDDYTYNDKNLSSVTSATVGTAVDVNQLRTQSVFVDVSGNTGAVTVIIEASANQSSWSTLSSATYTSTNTNQIFTFDYGLPFIRTKTTTQSNSTVTTTIYGRN